MKPWNPENLTDDVIEADKGWRLMSREEMAFMMPRDVQYYDGGGDWSGSSNAGLPMDGRFITRDDLYAYRTRAPLPPQFSGDDILGDLAKLLG